jgi:drug/metabolite transporter (DMT)-like permease
LLAAAASAGGVVVQKVVLRSVSPLQTTFLCCAVGAASCLAFAPGLVRDVERSPLASVLWMVYLGVFPTSVAFTTWAYALARTDAGRLGATIYVVPAMSILLAWLVLAEVPPPLAFAGGTLCVAGVVISRLPRRERRALTEEPTTSDATP